MKKRKSLIIMVCIVAVAAIGMIYVIVSARGTIGVSASNLEQDARKEQRIDDAWAVSKSIDENLGAMIFYNDTLDAHVFSIYINHPGLSFGYSFNAGGSSGAIAEHVCGFTIPSISSSALLSMNKACVAKIEIDDGIDITVINIDPDKPFAVVIPKNLGLATLYDVDGNIIPIIFM